jgi:hypothetical protein
MGAQQKNAGHTDLRLIVIVIRVGLQPTTDYQAITSHRVKKCVIYV